MGAAERKAIIPLRYGQRHAALGPALQNGQDWARGLHITLIGLLLVLFGWQAITGIAIVNKLLSA